MGRARPERREARGAVLRTLAFALAVLALVVRVAAPPGYMLANGENGFGVVLCTGATAVQTAAAHDLSTALGAAAGQAHKDKDAAKSDGQCPYAAQAHLASAPMGSLILAATAWAVVPSETVGRDFAPGLPPPARPPPARGPPADIV